MPHICDRTRPTRQVLAEVDSIAAERSLRLTPQRRHVLRLLLESDKAMGAYDLLPGLAAEGLGDKPVAAYRALDFLVEHGLAHRIEGMNAYVACCHPRQSHLPVFMVCRACKMVAESHDAAVGTGLDDAAGDIGFAIERRVIEAVGLCRDCQQGSEA